MVIERLRDALKQIVVKNPTPSDDTETEGTTEDFETPEMNEFLRENQTAKEL